MLDNNSALLFLTRRQFLTLRVCFSVQHAPSRKGCTLKKTSVFRECLWSGLERDVLLKQYLNTHLLNEQCDFQKIEDSDDNAQILKSC